MIGGVGGRRRCQHCDEQGSSHNETVKELIRLSIDEATNNITALYNDKLRHLIRDKETEVERSNQRLTDYFTNEIRELRIKYDNQIRENEEICNNHLMECNTPLESCNNHLLECNNPTNTTLEKHSEINDDPFSSKLTDKFIVKYNVCKNYKPDFSPNPVA